MTTPATLRYLIVGLLSLLCSVAHADDAMRAEVEALRAEAVRSRGFIRAAETQITKVIDAADALLAGLGDEPDPELPGDRDESPVGAAIPPLDAIYDRDANRWTVVDGVVMVNGQPGPYSKGVVKLEYVADGEERTLRQTNAAGGQWDLVAGKWEPVASETPEPPDEEPGENPPPPPVTGDMQIGVNVDEPHYWATAWVYADGLRQSDRYMNGSHLLFWDAPSFPKSGYTVEGPFKVEVAKNGIRITGPQDKSQGHVWLPGAKPGQKFHPLFLERLKPFRVLRFMDWFDTNGATKEPDWQLLDDAIDLCNELGADPWFNMGHLWSDEDVRKFAEIVKRDLHPKAKVYVEWSNECWNPGITHVFDWFKTQPGNMHDVWAREAKRDWGVWRSVFGQEKSRVVRVLAGQAANVWHLEQLVKRLGKGEFDAVSCAAYFSTKDRADELHGGSTLNDLFKMMEEDLAVFKGYYEAHARVAREYGVPLVAYEGGQHLVFYNKSWQHLAVPANRDPRMYDLYLKNARNFEQAGGSLLMYYTFTRRFDSNGSWGHLEYQDQPIEDAPKYRALTDYQAQEAR